MVEKMPFIETLIRLPEYVSRVLQHMFAKYEKIIVLRELDGGLSGSQVYLVRPIRQKNRTELTVVVKIDHTEAIQQEWKAYQECIQNRTSHVANALRKPIYPPGLAWGGIAYVLVGAGEFSIQSLCQFLDRGSSFEDIQHVLVERLFKSLSSLWDEHELRSPLHLRSEYDNILPVNLLLTYEDGSSLASPTILTPENAVHEVWRAGMRVQFANFRVEETHPECQGLYLNLPHVTQRFRFRINGVPNWDEYKVGDVLERPLQGIITQTRQTQLVRRAQELTSNFKLNLNDTFLSPSSNLMLPNPVTALPRILQTFFKAYTACVHGDLHLENVLVETQGRNPYVIDFAKAKEAHVIRDFLHLEMAIMRKLVAPAVPPKQIPQMMTDFYQRLHCAWLHPGRVEPPAQLKRPFAILQLIRQSARRYLHAQANLREEYYYGLYLYLLGVLRFKEERHETAVAFWGAAAILKLIDNEPTCDEFLNGRDDETIPSSGSYEDEVGEKDRTKTGDQTETHFYGKVTGPIHTGSGDINISNIAKPETRASEPKPKPKNKPRYNDAYSSYETGIRRFLTQVGRNHSRYLEALGYQKRLQDNIDRSRRFGDTNLRRADRAEIVEQLNNLSLSVADRSFNEMCQGTE